MIKKNNFRLIIISIMILGVLLLLLLNGCSLFRQYGSIEGYVYVPDTVNKGAIIIRDSKQVPTGYKPLPGAKVSVQDSYNFVFTDINGYFLLEDVTKGLVSLIIEPPINSGFNALTTQVMIEPDTTVPIGTYGAVSLPSEDAGYWDIVINQIDYSEYPEVKVYVQILDPINNTPMIGVKSDNFIIEINGNKIDTLSVTQAPGTTSYPASTSLVIDRSGSMEGEYGDDQPLIDAKEAAITFVNLMGINDRAEIISFGDNATIEQSFTNNKQALITAIEGISVHGWTALYDGIWQGLDDTATEANPRKAVIALTDGGENWSSSIHGGGDPPDNSLLIAHAQSLNVTVYTIGLAGYDFTREKVVRSYTTSEADLQEIAEETGGEYFYAPTSTDLEHIYVEITQRVQQQYIIAFTDNTGITDGILTVKVNYNQIYGEDSKDYEPYGAVVYRALLVGVGDYILSSDNDDLFAPPYDVDRVQQTLEHCKFGESNIEFAGNIYYWKDHYATKSNILGGINAIFSKADNNDISYFYFSGHGSRVENTSYLCPADVTSFADSAISIDELENALSTIPGTKVVFLDSCHSGGFIGKGKGEVTSDDLVAFNNEVINIFSQNESRDLLTKNEYIVLTSCHYWQKCSEIDPWFGDPYSYFTKALCEGCGYDTYNHPYPADINRDTKVSLQEAYIYIKNSLSSKDQDVQVYPENSNFPIAEY